MHSVVKMYIDVTLMTVYMMMFETFAHFYAVYILLDKIDTVLKIQMTMGNLLFPAVEYHHEK